MREKLEKIIDAYEELEQKLGDPQVLADQHEYNKLAKSYADQGPLVVAARKYVQDLNDLAEAKEMLSDADMKEFAQEEISRIEGELPQLEEDIKFMLIPSDPADEKNIIVEIRAAAGGDEAAIFAGDLYKMYLRFADHHGWKVEAMDVSPSEAGGYKEIQFKVTGNKVYSVMKFESGVTASSEFPKRKARAASIPQRLPLPFFPRRTKSISTSKTAIFVSTCSVLVDRAVSALTLPTQRSASRTCLRAWWSSLKIRRASCRTRLPQWPFSVLVCTRRCSQSSRQPKAQSVWLKSDRATVLRRSVPTTPLRIV
jgi:hypothetical protein